MADERDESGFWSTAKRAFLTRRLHHLRMRAAALRALRQVEPGGGDGLQMLFDADPEPFAHAGRWHTDIGAAPAEDDAPPVDVLPRLSLAILVVGSRGDVQPFIPLGRRLAEHHRVRIASHAQFRAMVEDAGLEFFPLAGDPRELMDYMVRTGGRIVPTRLDQLVEDVPRKRAVMAEILASTWRACTEPDPDRPDAESFVADAILANPPSYGHVHCAEALAVPLQMVFTMPWSPTSAFPHPLARLPVGEEQSLRNWFSYAVADLLTWGGIGDLVNEFREQTLGLPPIDLRAGAALLNDREVPYIYLWPASLVPKPPDWGPHIELTNFIFHDQASSYEPPADLRAFLAAGDPPIYVGFGSCVVADPERLTRIVFEALERVGARGLVSQGWGALGGEAPPAHVHVIGDTPHDWLFGRCRAVCHHGGAGTTAAGLRAGLPTVVVPFFGDQFFWGQVIADAGAGPPPLPAAELTAEALAEAFADCARPERRARAQALAAAIRAEDGVARAVHTVHRRLPLAVMACAHDGAHLATLFCESCRTPVCEACTSAAHDGHATRPYRYVDWGAPPESDLAADLRHLLADAVSALRAGIDELTPSAAPHFAGVVDDRDASGATERRRWRQLTRQGDGQ